jgi:FkbH-like protein
LIDWKFYYLTQLPLNPKLASAFREWFNRQLEIIDMKRKKCIVLDLDNTLWAGILGEDGIEGIKMGETYPGNTYRFFQEFLLELSRTGILLTICSKNNESDVMEVLEKHPDMLLKKEHFAAYRINWDNKADNIKEIAEMLNLGLDSFVFVDDNPTERELIKQMLPQVSVPEFPKQPYNYPLLINDLIKNYFCAYKLTREDLVKTQQYKENAERVQFQSHFFDFESYLRSLEIELNIEKLNELNITRFAQMTQKTNQFNLTTHRYTETDIRKQADNGAWVYGLRVKDRFGDNGITGLIIIKINQQEAEIDTLLLSCRILGRKIENVFVQYMLNKLKTEKIKTVESSYIKTLKNSQVEMFYDRLNFMVKEHSDNQKHYTMNLVEMNFSISELYKLIEK